MSLHRVSIGEGPDVALLHGWGLHGGIFNALAERLSARFRVHVLDLPGHGRSPWSKGADDLEGLSRLVAAHLPEQCALVGWSLGGLVAQRMAFVHPQRVTRMVLLATGVLGARRRDFQQAADPQLLAGLADRLQRDWRATVLEFLNVEVRGDDNPLEALRALRQAVDASPAPNAAALRSGLTLLQAADLRVSARQIVAPTLVIAGEYDRIVPPEGARALADLIPGAQLKIIRRAAHAPFLSRRDEVEPLIEGFLAP